jgi:hypothetical protein
MKKFMNKVKILTALLGNYMNKKLFTGIILVLSAVFSSYAQQQDYIPMTNVTRSVERQEIRVGDEFMGFTLIGFNRWPQRYGAGGRNVREDKRADFSGRLTISGTLHGSTDDNFWMPGWGSLTFEYIQVNESDYQFIPYPENGFDIRFQGFMFNSDIDFSNDNVKLLELLELAGLCTEIINEINNDVIRSIQINDVTVTVDKFSVSTSGSFQNARIVEINFIGEVFATRLGGDDFVYVKRRNQQGQELERLTEGDEFAGLTVEFAGSQLTTTNHIFDGWYREAWIGFTGEKTLTADIIFGRDAPVPQQPLFNNRPHLVVHRAYHELFPIFPREYSVIDADEVFIRIENPDELFRMLEIEGISDTRNLRIKINKLRMYLYEGYFANVIEILTGE